MLSGLLDCCFHDALYDTKMLDKPKWLIFGLQIWKPSTNHDLQEEPRRILSSALSNFRNKESSFKPPDRALEPLRIGG
jgi:hypothetical protein